MSCQALRVLAAFLLASANILYPQTPKKPVSDNYHGVAVVDEYRWLENFEDPAVKQWANAQTSAARSFLDALPERNGIAKELAEMYMHSGVRFRFITQRGGNLFAYRTDPQKQHPTLVTMARLDDPNSSSTVLDPDSIDPKHLTAIDFVSVSVDGRYVAASLSMGGSESGTVHVYEVATGRALPDVIPRVNEGTAGGSVSWNAEGTGFYYTRYPNPGERASADLDFYQQIYFHKLGETAAQDTYSLGKEFSRIAETQLHSSFDGRYLVATVKIGDGGDAEHWMLAPGEPWRLLAHISDEVKEVVFGFHNDLFLLSRKDARRGKVLHLGVKAPLEKATSVVPQSDVVIEDLSASSAGLFIRELAGGPSKARFLAFRDGKLSSIPAPAISAIYSAAALEDGRFVFTQGDYLSPVSEFYFQPKTLSVTAAAPKESAPISTEAFEVVREFAVSKDGTKVPLNIMRPKGLALDGSHPTVLTGYGGYGISLAPRLSVDYLALLRNGIVVVQANLRGGGEYGEEWHEAGKLTKKQNVFDDFTACAEYLISHRYTQPSKLGIIGGSNGGLLMGAVMTQHPELFHAVVSEVGIYDMLRVELSPNGAFNVTEFGTVKEADQFRAMYAYSPYHHVKQGTQYPAVLFTTGDNDPRVDPMNSRKMVAKMQAAGTREPVLLRTSHKAGHGIGSSMDERIALSADAITFLVHELTSK